MSLTIAALALASLATTRPAGPVAREPVSAIVARLASKARTPSFARQTKLSCNVCHLGGFPQLTRFGRLFKLNGYTLSGLPQITGQVDSATRRSLELSSIPGLSVMALVSATSTARKLPATPSLRTEYPQQLSVFFGGEISPRLGALAQLTYSDATGKVAIDNTDVRFAAHTKSGSKDILYGLTLHNNPTVQDVWNTAPAWAYPFASPALAPHPSASTLIDGALAQSVLGLGAYSLFDNVLYAEGTLYTSAPSGPRSVVDSTQTNNLRDVAPYWRVVLQNRSGPFYASIGASGLYARLYPTGSTGQTNDYNDVGVDAQFEQTLESSVVVGRVSYMHESQSLAADYTAHAAQNVQNTLSTFRVSGMFAPTPSYALTLGYVRTNGSKDDVRYAPDVVTGSRLGRPTTDGEIAEGTWSPWLNTRLGAQYTMYQHFNGGAHEYDVLGGRSASDNRTLYVYLWFAF